MRVIVAAVGRLKDGPERALYDHYATRFSRAGQAVSLGPLDTFEIPESRAKSAKLRKEDEAQRLLKHAGNADLVFVLDPNGRALESTAFAQRLERARDDGVSACALLIGGPDGHGREAINAHGAFVMSLGPMTLPHGLARVVVGEQLYRAATILSGHPYHRQ